MNKAIKDSIKNVQEKPGVYKMLDAKLCVLYVGKAKNLKKRLQQYLGPLSNRLQLMISQVNSVSTIVTNNEVEALILESKLVKKLQPKYNILLKDDKSFPYIIITRNHKFPRLTKYRGKYKEGCYGPIPSTEKLDNTISVLHRIFKLRSCTNRNFISRKRPCLEYQIKRCSAPCVGKISEEEYSNTVKQAINVLRGKQKYVQSQLNTLMENASKNLEFELAAHYRDSIRSLQYLQFQQQHIKKGDIIGIHREGDVAQVKVLSFLKSNLQNQYFYTMKNVDFNTKDEIISTFILQFYKDEIANNIISNYALSQTTIKVIETLYNKKINFQQPKKGIKLQVLQMVCNSIKQNFYSHNIENCLKLLKDIFLLSKTPQRVEVYDNSHTSGKEPVGVMVVIDQNGFNKKEYRIFNITTNTSDDYCMMQEVLKRRIHNTIIPSPDFILIDGGKGHMSVIKNILNNIPFICISKGKKRNSGDETFHALNKKSFKLEQNNPLLFFLQRIRDEAHRFAINSHRKKRNKNIRKSKLDDIPGLGPKRKRLLLIHFGSVENIKQATVEQISSVKGISKNLAENILYGKIL